MDGQQHRQVVGRNGRIGRLLSIQNINNAPVAEIELDNGARLHVPQSMLTAEADGTYSIPFNLNDMANAAVTVDRQTAAPAAATARSSEAIPVVREEIQVGKRVQETGRVAVHITPHVRQEVVDVELASEHVDIERVPLNQIVDSPRAPREEGDVMIVPVYEEVAVVEKRLLLKEEIRIRRRKTTHHERKAMQLRTEEVEVLRADAPVARRDM